MNNTDKLLIELLEKNNVDCPYCGHKHKIEERYMAFNHKLKSYYDSKKGFGKVIAFFKLVPVVFRFHKHATS